MSSPISASQWSSRFGFLMAAVGSSVGLGNLWRFSAEAGSNGGGAFILVYILCVLFIALPILSSELLIGRAGQGASPVHSLSDVAKKSSVSQFWNLGAWAGMVGAFLIVSFYCVVAAWVLAYIPKFLFGEFVNKTPSEISDQFDTLLAEPGQVFFWFILFCGVTSWFIARGVNRGIELASKLLMPTFFILLLFLCIYSLVTGWESGGTIEAIKFLYLPDLSKISGDVAIGALGQAFFSLGVGSAIMITYGSYLPRDINIPRSAGIIAFADTLVALIAGFAIFPIVFSFNLDFESGAGLFFQTLPIGLSQMPAGQWIGGSFFCLAIFAALTSSIALLEPTVAHISEKFNISKAKAACIGGFMMMFVGLLSLFNLNIMDLLDRDITGGFLLPLSGLIVVIFVGHRLNKTILDDEVEFHNSTYSRVLFFFVRYVSPIFVALLLCWGLFDRYIKSLF